MDEQMSLAECLTMIEAEVGKYRAGSGVQEVL